LNPASLSRSKEDLVTKRSSDKGSDSRKLEPAPFEAEKVIEALVGLKKKRKYPALPGQIRTALSFPESKTERLKKYLRSLGKAGVVMPAKKGRYVAYMLAGEDPRYSGKMDEALKFELLAEIERLKGEILEIQAGPARPEPSHEKKVQARAAITPQELEEEVLRRIAALSRSRNRRTVDLWEVRRALEEIPSETLDKVLEKLGASWRLELQPVQDSTRLSAEEKATLLKLADGTLIGALAIARD
jgi:hypothetical protein